MAATSRTGLANASLPTGGAPPIPITNPLNTYNIQELMKLLTLMLPYFVVFLFIMISIINSNIKGFVYFFGLIIIYAIIKLFQGSIPNNTHRICAIFDSYHYVHPSFISALYAYTLTFMIMPMAIYFSKKNCQ